MNAAFAISSECFAAGATLAEICSQAAASAGLEIAIGVGADDAIIPSNVTTASGAPAAMRDVADAARTHAERIVNVHFNWPTEAHLGRSENDTAARLLESAIQAAADVGAPTLSFAPAVVGPPPGVSYEDAHNNVYERLIELSFVAERANVVLSVVPAVGGFLLSPVETRDYIARVNSPFVGAMVDANAIATVGFPEQWVCTLGRYLVGVRIAVDGTQDRIDVEGIRSAMDAAGLDPPIVRTDRWPWDA